MTPVDRRSLLKGGVAVTGAAALASTLATPARAESVMTAPATLPASTPAPGQAYVAPYSVTTSSALSQDYFDTAAVLMDSPNDLVAPFTLNGQVSALVLSSSNGALSLLQPEASQPSGWALSAVPDPDGDPTNPTPLQGVQSVAVANWGHQVWALLILSPDPQVPASTPTWEWYVNAQDGSGWNATILDDLYLDGGVGPAQSGFDPNGDPYFYAFNDDGSFYLWAPAVTDSYDYTLITDLQGQTFTAPQLIWDPEDAPATGAGVWVVGSDGDDVFFTQTGMYSFQLQNDVSIGGQLLWTGWAVQSATPTSAVVFQDTSGHLFYQSQGSDPQNLATFSTLTQQQVVPWLTSDGVASFGVLAPDTTQTPSPTLLSILSGSGDSSNLAFTPAIAIADTFQAIYGLPSDPAQSTLFAIDDKLTLWVMSRDPNATADGLVGMWNPVQVMHAGASAQELTNWRTQITVLDANGIGVAGADVMVTPDRTVGVWQTSGSTSLTPQDPQPFTTNDYGQITLAVVTWALEAPQWTVQLLDESSNPSGDPVDEAPDLDVHRFLAGTDPLPMLGTLTGSSLLAATSPDGSGPLSPVLNDPSMTPAQQQQAAGAVVSGINQAMSVGLTPTAPNPGDVNSFNLDLVGWQFSRTTASLGAREPAKPAGAMAVTDSDWWDAVKHDLHSLEHAIRKGLAKAVSVAAQWADDVGGWVISIGLDIENLGTQIASFTVNTLHSAITAVHGIFAAIAVDAETVIRWIRMGLDDVLGHAEANAQVVLGWIGTTLPDFATQQLQGIDAFADGFFSDLKSDVASWVDQVGTSIGGSSFTDLLATPSDSTSGSAGLVGSSVLTDISNVLTGVHHNWLVDKIKSAIDGGPPNFAGSDPLQKAMESVDSGYNQGFGGDSALQTMSSNMWAALDQGPNGTNAIGQGSDFKGLLVSALLDTVEAGADGLLDLADSVVNDTLTLMVDIVDGLADTLTTTSPGAQLIVDVLSKLGVHADLSFGHIAGMVAMFPTTIVYQFATQDGSLLFPSSAYTATTSSPSILAGSADTSSTEDYTLSLKYVHALSRALLAIAQPITDVNALKAGYTAGLGGLPKFVLIFTPFFGLLIAAATYKGAKDSNGDTAPPWTTAPATGNTPADLFLTEMVCGWALGLLGLAFAISPPGGDSAISGEFALAVNELVAVGDLVVTIYADVLNDSDAFTFATQMLERAPAVTTFGVFRPVVDATDSISFFVKTFTDIGIDLAAGGMLLDDAIKAT
jgi:hypothetical protein